SSITGEQLTLNMIDIQYNNKAENGMGALADEINRYSSTTGIKATAVVQSTSSVAIQAGSTGSDFAINGVTIGAITVQANDADNSLVNGINAKKAETGVEASTTADGKLVLTSVDGRAIKVTGDVSDVLGSTAGQMSTIGYIKLVQSGVTQFQISGIGAGATGADITISGDVTTVEDSVLAAGSTIVAGSRLAAGTVLGGDARVESTVSSTQLDTEIKAGSTLYFGSKIAKGTTLSGSVLVAGVVDASAEKTNNTTTALSQDMLVAKGSVLNEGTVLGKGTVVTTQFTVGSTTYNVGDTLTSAVTLDSELTLTADMTLKYSSTSSDNSKVAAGSILTEGTQLGADFTIGYTYDNSANTTTITGNVTTTSDIYVTTAITGNSAEFTEIKAGSLLKSGTVLRLDTSVIGTTWTGPTLVHTGGVLKRGDKFTDGMRITLSGDQVISEDLDDELEAATGAGQNSIAAGSILLSGFKVTSATAGKGNQITQRSDAILSSDMTLKAGSTIQGGSHLMAGSVLGSNTYVYGGDISSDAGSITTYQTTQLKAGSLLESGSVLAEGSTVGAKVTLAAKTTLDSDMTLTAGSVLKYTAGANNTLLKAGTVITQDMTLNTGNSGTASTEVQVHAGDVLTDDLYLDADVTLSSDMTIKEDSILAANSVIGINTANAGTVGLSDTAISRLSDLNVLSAEGAQLAIDIADAALKDLGNVRSSLGSVQNQLTSTVANLSVTQTNVSAAESNIRDVDFAAEAANFSRLQVLAQAGTFALAQSNASAQLVLSLLQ
ncbi:MAG: hypothetical protein D6736_02115, partial [Nitrospinota bacterium]